MIRDAHCDKVALETDIRYIANYIDLQQARLPDAVQIDGLAFFKSLTQQTLVIFTTVYSEYAVESYDVEAVITCSNRTPSNGSARPYNGPMSGGWLRASGARETLKISSRQRFIFGSIMAW